MSVAPPTPASTSAGPSLTPHNPSSSQTAPSLPQVTAGIPQLPDPGTPTVPFLAGTTLASLPSKEYGPVDLPRQWAWSLLLTHKLKSFSSFETFYALDREIRPLFLLRGVTPSKSANNATYNTGFTYLSTGGSRGAKEAAARRVLADGFVETCLSILRHFPDLQFVILPEPPPTSPALRTRESGPSSSGPAVKRSRQSQTPALKKNAAAPLPSTRGPQDTTHRG